MVLKNPVKLWFATLVLALFAVSVLTPGTVNLATAAVTTPSTVNYQGRLLDNVNAPLTGDYDFRFSLWDNADLDAGEVDGAGAINVGDGNYGGWNEVQTVTTDAFGMFNIAVGAVSGLPPITTTNQYLMVEVKANGDPNTSYEVLDPNTANATVDRKTIHNNPFANNSDTLDGADVGTADGNIATLTTGGVWDISRIPGGSNAETFVLNNDDTAGNVTLQFGAALNETITFDTGNSWFAFSDDIQLNQNELKGAAIDNLAAAPGTPVAGQIYHNTTDNNTYVWNGGAWEDITASGGSVDLDGAYDNDVGKNLLVDDAAGLTFTSSVAGDITVNLGNTGDFVVQDNGTPFAIFSDGGHVTFDSNAANTVSIFTLENTGGDFDIFRTDATPEATVTASIGDIAVDGTNGVAYIKNSGDATNTGWQQFAGSVSKEATFQAEYKDSTAEGDGTNNKGILSSDFEDSGGADKRNYYEWETTQGSLQDVDVVLSFKLPLDFVGFTGTPLSIMYQTGDANIANNRVDISMFDTTGTAVTLGGNSALASAGWTTANVTIGGSPTFTAGEKVTLRLKLSALSTGLARVADVVFQYIGQQ